MNTLTYTDTLTILECGACHISFAMPEQMHRKVKRTGDFFWCPKGCKIHYYEDENTRLKAQLDQAEADARYQRDARDRALAEAKSQQARANGYKGQLVRTKKRQAKGVCPCCTRSFVNVARHMESQHPGYGADQ